MKTKLIAVFSFALMFGQLNASTTHFSPVTTTIHQENKGGDPSDLKVVVSQKRIWLIADEMPVKCLKTQIKDASGKVVLEKCFSSKCAEWFLNIESLPKGEYTLYLGTERIEKFKK